MTTNTMISLFPSAMANEPDAAISIEDFLQGVQGGRWQRKIEILREHIKRGDRLRYDKKKRELPAVTISCHCLSRERALSPEAKAITHSGLLQADFDLKDNPTLSDPAILTHTRQQLMADPHVLAVFVGPSGEGIKAIIAINPERHTDSWFAAESHFRGQYGLTLDKATKDPMRLCFVSFDPDADWRDEADILPVPDSLPANGGDSWHPPVETTAADIEEMLKFIPSRPDYDTWLRVASAVWSVLPLEDGCRVLASWSPEEKPGEYAFKHRARLEQISIGSLVHLASQHGFDAREAWRRKRWAGRIRFAEGTRAPGQGEDPTADPTPQNIVTEISRERVMQAFASGQAGDARLWCDMRRNLRVYNIHAKMWMVYEDGIWRRDAGHSCPWDISDTCKTIYEGIASSVQQEIKTNPAPDDKKDVRKKEVDGILKRCDALSRWDYVSSVNKFAAAAMHLPATAFDANPDILVVRNGTLDFAEGIFREHRPADLATIRSPLDFDPDADCPHWTAFLERCIPEVETRAYLARAIGYSLTGRVNQDALFFCYGKGANGKSTFFLALKILLGDLMTTVPIAALLAAKSDNNYDYHKASMEGKRVVLTDEIPEGRSLAEGQVKGLTGGDAINARRPFEQPYTFLPTHKLWLMGNHKPDIKGTDNGIWRRVHMIPFLVTIPDNERRDRHEIEAEFKSEASGILNWAIRGLIESRDIGLNPPQQVVDATKEYREESDQFGTFLNECTEKNIVGRCGIGSLAKCYAIWCEENSETPRHKGTRQLRKAMMERGWHVESDRKNHPTVHGLQLQMPESNNILEMQS
jgi:putative DNA primase/helicase